MLLHFVLFSIHANIFFVNTEKPIKHGKNVWYCKCIITSDSIFFKSKRGFCKEGEVETREKKSGCPHLSDVTSLCGKGLIFLPEKIMILYNYINR
mgnify:CR=1 FL=1